MNYELIGTIILGIAIAAVIIHAFLEMGSSKNDDLPFDEEEISGGIFK